MQSSVSDTDTLSDPEVMEVVSRDVLSRMRAVPVDTITRSLRNTWKGGEPKPCPPAPSPMLEVEMNGMPSTSTIVQAKNPNRKQKQFPSRTHGGMCTPTAIQHARLEEMVLKHGSYFIYGVFVALEVRPLSDSTRTKGNVRRTFDDAMRRTSAAKTIEILAWMRDMHSRFAVELNMVDSAERRKGPVQHVARSARPHSFDFLHDSRTSRFRSCQSRLQVRK